MEWFYSKYLNRTTQDHKHEIMEQIVIGIFDTSSQAEAAVETLVAANFSIDNMDVSDQTALRERGDVTDQNTLNSSIGRFFTDIFNNSNDALRYAAVAQQGIVVAIQVNDYDEAVRAADILDQCGAINVDERARTLEDSWTREDRTSGYAQNRTGPSVKVYPGIAEYNNNFEKPDDDLAHSEQRTVETNNIRMQSRIIERSAGDSTRVREEETTTQHRPAHSNDEEKDLQERRDLSEK